MNAILVTPRSLSRGHPALNALSARGFSLVMPAPGAIPDEATLIAALPGCVGWLAGVEPVSEEVIAAADRLRVISRNGTGVDNLPLAALERRQIRLYRAEGTNARGVAELALCLTFAGLRHLVRTHEGMRACDWPRHLGREIAGARVAVIGLGAIGATFARMCLDLGAQVAAHDPFAPMDRLTHPRLRRVPLAEALEGAEVVSLHAPLPEDGRPLLTAPRIATLARGATVVNTARAGLVEEAAMLTALDAGQVGTYATDVFDTEPPASSALTSHPGVILTSHIGGFTDASVERCTVRAVENLLIALDAAGG
jgi:D-3-phosphoglycerate dehydrogenase / 2-oxoglutarate reductase